jgi:hypothetical protein
MRQRKARCRLLLALSASPPQSSRPEKDINIADVEGCFVVFEQRVAVEI